MPDIEVLCINDGSTDASLSIITSYTQSDERFILIDKKNEGYGASCNRGIETARGQYISIIEPDDYIDPLMYEEMLSFGGTFFKSIDIIKAAWVDVMNWNKSATLYEKPGYLYKRLKTSTAPFTIKAAPILLETHPAIWSALYRRDFLMHENIRFRPYPGAGWADNPFLIDTLVRAQSIVFLDKMYYHYRNDLPKTKKVYRTELNLLPMQRWLEMTGQLKDLQVTEEDIWAAHYVRGFNYLDTLAEEYEFEMLAEHSLVKQVFTEMDKKIVLSIEKISPEKKRFFLDIRGEESRNSNSLSYKSYLAKELLHRIKAYGMSETVRSIRNRPDGFV